MMAKGASTCLFLFLLLVLIVSSSGTLVGFFNDGRESNAIQSATETISFLKLQNVHRSQIRVFITDQWFLDSFSKTSVHIDLYLNKTLAENLRNHKLFATSWFKTHFLTSLPHVKIKKIIVSSSSSNELPLLLSTLKSVHSMLSSFHLEKEVEVSLSMPLSFFENRKRKHEKELQKIFNIIKKSRSFVVIEANANGGFSKGDQFVKLAINRVNSVTSVLPDDVSMVLNIKSSVVPGEQGLAGFNGKVSRYLENLNQRNRKKIIGLFVEVSDFDLKELKMEEEQILHSSHRELLKNFQYETTRHDLVLPPKITFSSTKITNPVTTPANVPLDNPAPTIVTVPGTNPGTVTLTPPSSPIPPPSPVNSPIPITNPVTTPSTNPGAQPVTNPVTTYPAPSAGVPVNTPVTTPVMPPAGTNSPAVPGQSWCVAKSGALQTALQSALDYACGIGGADCSTIQQGGSCYNPNTLQNHASYAFNSYYQKHPGQTSCDFGGTAMITNSNPSTGSCIYPSSPSPTTSSSSGTAVPGSISPPPVLNGSNPASGSPTVFGETPPIVFGDSPTSTNSTSSISTSLHPFIGCIILIASVVTGKLFLDM